MGKININAMINCDDKEVSLCAANYALKKKSIYTKEEIKIIENFVIIQKLLGTTEYEPEDIFLDWEDL
jgi:hypothetical protein